MHRKLNFRCKVVKIMLNYALFVLSPMDHGNNLTNATQIMSSADCP